MRTASKRGVRKEYRILETDVWKWTLAESKRLGKLPTKITIQNYAQEKYRTAGYEDFKASKGWYRRWVKRYKLKDPSTFTVASTLVAPPSIADEMPVSEPVPQSEAGTSNGGLNETLESFSIATDKLINDIEMINSPSEFFDFIESAIDVADSSDASMKSLMNELMDDFGRYCTESDNREEGSVAFGRLASKKSCKYDKDFKDKVIGFISNHHTGIMKAAAKFKISPETVSIWMKESKFQEQFTQIFVKESSRTNIDREIRLKESDFCNWLCESEKTSKVVSKEEVQEKLSSYFTLTWRGKSHWFAKYCTKYLHKQESHKPMKINYSIQFQKLMVNYAAKTSQIRAASVFNVARKQIFNWMKNVRAKNIDRKKQIEEELYEWYDSKSLKPVGRVIREKAEQLFDGDRAPKISYSWYYNWCAKNNIPVKRNCDEEIVHWILGAYDRNVKVSHEDVRMKALKTYKSYNENNTFKASTRWLLRFCRRYMNILRRTPPLSATLPLACESNVRVVRERALKILIENRINEDCFGVMDEVLLKLKPDATSSTQLKPLLKSCGANNIQGTVLLTCLSNGEMLPPVLTLKDKYDITTNHVERFPIIQQPYGMVDDNVMQFWMTNVWFKHVGEPNLLMVDCFEPHTSEITRKKFEERKSHLIIIPPGCSSKLNPLTQIITPQFQEIIDQHCCKWFEEDSLSWQMDGISMSLSSQNIIDWVGKAFDGINTKSMQENVRNVFKSMEFTITEDGKI